MWSPHTTSYPPLSLTESEAAWSPHAVSFSPPHICNSSCPIRGGVDLTRLLICSPLAPTASCPIPGGVDLTHLLICSPLAPTASCPIQGGVDLTHLLVCSPLLIQRPAQYKASRRWFGPNIVPLSHPLAPLNDPEIPMRGGTGPPLCMYCSFLCIIVGAFDTEYYTYSLFLYLEIRTKGIIKNAVIPA